MAENFAGLKKFLAEQGVTLVAVSKTRSPEEVMHIYNSGQLIFGENNAQELVSKQEQLPGNIAWHLIGHLQTNKVRYIAPFVSLIQSVDSFRLLQEIDKQAKNHNRIIPVLLQIYIAKEETKFGLSFNEAIAILNDKKLLNLEHIFIKGLMGIATFTNDQIQISKEFKSLANFFKSCGSYESSNVKMELLSMGMSGDYKLAVEQGSNMVRIGSLLFGERT